MHSTEHTKTTRCARGALLLLGLMTPAPLLAQDTASTVASTAAAPAPAIDRWSLDMGVSWVSTYISRGKTFAEPASVQPYAALTLALPELDTGAATGTSLTLGTFASGQSGGPGAGQGARGGLSHWYEADASLTLATTFKSGLTASAGYVEYTSPSHSYDPYGEVILRFSCDDSPWWQGRGPAGFSLAPALRVIQQVGLAHGSNGLYVEPSLTPTLHLGGGTRDLRLSVPLVAGFARHYYRAADGSDRMFGYVRTGMALSGKIAPVHAPRLRLTAAVDVWIPNAAAANTVTSTQVVGRLGISAGF